MEETLVSPTEATVLYMSRRSGLRLTMRPRYPLRDPVSGQLTGSTPGVFIGFQDGQVRVPKSGQYTTVDTLNGGRSEPIDAADVHDWLQRHHLFGDRQEGFWRVDPTAPPVSQDEMRAMMNAATLLDEETLQAIIDQEEAGWGREAILNTAREALDRIADLKEQAAAQAQQEEQAAPKKPGPKPKAQPEG